MQALLVEAEKLDDEARGRIKREIPAENGARGVRLADSKIKETENERVGDALIKLRGMQRNAEWHAGQLGGLRVAERDGPGHMRRDAPAAARRKTPDAADGLAERDAGREDVAGGKDRQVLAAHVQDGRDERDQETALVHAGGLQRAQREQRTRIVPIGLEIEQDHEQLGAGQSGERAIDGQIGDRLRGKAGALGQADDNPQRGQKSDGHQRSVGRNKETTDRY